MTEPPFRAEHIGSLLRPKALLDLRRRHERGLAGDTELQTAETAAIADAIALQERVGLRVVTDGELRRQAYHSYFFGKLGDVTLSAPAESDHQHDAQGAAAPQPRRAAQPQAVIRSRLSWTGPIHAGDLDVLRARSRATPKITIPGPCALHFRGGDAAVLAHAYRDVDEFWSDIVAAYGKELHALDAAGGTYVQIDETAFAKFGDGEVRASLAARGDEWSRLIDSYIAITNRVVAGAPPGLRLGMHLCRGNRGGQFHAEGSYEAVADRLFNALDIDLFFLEYDSPRAGDFAPLRLLPKDKHIVLGLVSTKSGALESKDDLARRIEEAGRHVDLARLSISPQCGFASVDTGNPLTPEAQEAKLRLVVDTARLVWGTA